MSCAEIEILLNSVFMFRHMIYTCQPGKHFLRGMRKDEKTWNICLISRNFFFIKMRLKLYRRLEPSFRAQIMVNALTETARKHYSACTVYSHCMSLINNSIPMEKYRRLLPKNMSTIFFLNDSRHLIETCELNARFQEN